MIYMYMCVYTTAAANIVSTTIIGWVGAHYNQRTSNIYVCWTWCDGWGNAYGNVHVCAIGKRKAGSLQVQRLQILAVQWRTFALSLLQMVLYPKPKPHLASHFHWLEEPLCPIHLTASPTQEQCTLCHSHSYTISAFNGLITTPTAVGLAARGIK